MSRILVVGDDKDVVEVVSGFLNARGFKGSASFGFEEALGLLKEGSYDGMVLFGTHGMWTFHALVYSRSIPCVMVGRRLPPELKDAAVRCGAKVMDLSDLPAARWPEAILEPLRQGVQSRN